MKCKKCKAHFNPYAEFTVGDDLGTDDQQSVEVRTKCTKCGAKHYTFVEDIEFILDPAP